METSSSDDDWCEDGFDEDDMGLIAEPEDPVPLMSRLGQLGPCTGFGDLSQHHRKLLIYCPGLLALLFLLVNLFLLRGLTDPLGCRPNKEVAPFLTCTIAACADLRSICLSRWRFQQC